MNQRLYAMFFPHQLHFSCSRRTFNFAFQPRTWVKRRFNIAVPSHSTKSVSSIIDFKQASISDHILPHSSCKHSLRCAGDLGVLFWLNIYSTDVLFTFSIGHWYHHILWPELFTDNSLRHSTHSSFRGRKVYIINLPGHNIQYISCVWWVITSGTLIACTLGVYSSEKPSYSFISFIF